ncbi:MAG: toll/interleukin-1 receptor domain-containing protein, partial [Planctomycetota bacterium]
MQEYPIEDAKTKINDSAEYELFISHRLEDKDIALSLKSFISLWSRARITVHVCEEILGGDKWYDWIENRISQSNILLFLCTSEKVDWGWCLYEVGLFRNPKDPKKGRLVCISNVDMEKLPSPIRQFKGYDSTKDGMKEFFMDLLIRGNFTKGVKFVDEIERSLQISFDSAVDSMVELFQRSRIETKFYAHRISIKFNEAEPEKETVSLEDAYITSDRETMGILQVPDRKIYWKDLYANLNKDGKSPWLDEISDSLEKIQSIGTPKEVMSPFKTPKGWFIPVLTRVEKAPSSKPNQSAIPRRMCVIFVPTVTDSYICEPLETQRPHPKDILDAWKTYIPCNVVRLRWKKKSEDLEYSSDDLDQEPIVYAINPAFAQLYNFSDKEFPNPNGIKPLTSNRLYKRLEEYIEPIHLEKLKEDQARISEQIIFKSMIANAMVPLQFNEKHPHFPGAAFLPCLVCKHVVGEVTSPHETYLLV